MTSVGDVVNVNHVVDSSAAGGINIQQTNLTLTAATITDNEGHGVKVNFTGRPCQPSDDPTRPTQIFGNEGFEIFNNADLDGGDLTRPGNVDARNVYWDTLDPSQISTGIFDFFDAGSQGIVFFRSIRDSNPRASDAGSVND